MLDPFKHDDPYRVAPPYQAPGEVEPDEVPEVSEAEAARLVLDAIASDEPINGESARTLIEYLIDAIVCDEQGEREAVLTLLSPMACPRATHNTLKRLRGRCHDLVNGELP